MALTAQDLGCCCGGTVSFCGCTGLPSTLNLTHTVLGAFTLTKGVSTYTGSITYNYPGNAFCQPYTIAGSVTISAILTCVVSGSVWNVTYNVLGSSFCSGGPSSVGECPTNNGLNHAILTKNNVGGALVCSPFSDTFSHIARTQGCAAGQLEANMMLGAASTTTVTP